MLELCFLSPHFCVVVALAFWGQLPLRNLDLGLLFLPIHTISLSHIPFSCLNNCQYSRSYQIRICSGLSPAPQNQLPVHLHLCTPQVRPVSILTSHPTASLTKLSPCLCLQSLSQSSLLSSYLGVNSDSSLSPPKALLILFPSHFSRVSFPPPDCPLSHLPVLMPKEPPNWSP